MEIPALTNHTSALWKGKQRNGSRALNKTTSELSDILVYTFCSYNCSLSVKYFASSWMLSAVTLCLRGYWILLLQLHVLLPDP
jgi:hypothetical protein